MQSLHQDGSLHLHTRSLKYGKVIEFYYYKIHSFSFQAFSTCVCIALATLILQVQGVNCFFNFIVCTWQLGNGQLVKVAPYLIKRLKQHFHQLKDLGVDLILGCNGFIWISATSASGNKGKLQVSDSAATSASDMDFTVQFEVRERICRLANSVRVLGALGLLVSPDSIMHTYDASLLWEVPVKDMLSADFYVKLAEKEAEQRSKR